MTRTSLLACLFVLTACNPTPAPMDDAAIVTDAGPPDTGAPMTCAPVAPTCVDQQISMLNLLTTVSTRTVEEETSTISGAHQSHIDSMGGGLDPNESYVYARFTDTGLMRVSVSDQDALASSDWDIAFRRFIIRLNSGVSGPSCVQGARTAGGTTFESVTAVPSGLAFHAESYMTADPDCTVVPDGSGLGSPDTVLSSFWTYPGCVSMSHNVYVIQLANNRHVKLEVLGYYNPADQTICDGPTHGMPTATGSSGNIRIQWAYLD